MKLNNYCFTESQKSYIGKSIDTRLGNTLTVEGFEKDFNKKGFWKRKYIFSCNVCSKDEELWPHGSISSTKGNIDKGKIPCGCWKGKILTEAQNNILVSRKSEYLGYVFSGWEGEYKGSNTKLKLYNPVTGNSWNTTTLTLFLSGTQDPSLKQERAATNRKVPFKDSLNEVEAMFPTYIICQNSTRKDFKIKCNNCATDSFGEKGLCSGVFNTTFYLLKQGHMPCRCSRSPRLTLQQLHYKVCEKLQNKGGTLLFFPVHNVIETSELIWKCRRGHVNTKRVGLVSRGDFGCIKCRPIDAKESGRFNGYDPTRTEDPDLLYIIRFKDTFIKCGRAFIMERRLKHSSGLLKKSGCTRDQLEILHVYTGTHQEVYDTEQFVIDELTERGFYYKTWTRETFSLDSERLMIDLIENHSTLTKIEYVEGM